MSGTLSGTSGYTSSVADSFSKSSLPVLPPLYGRKQLKRRGRSGDRAVARRTSDCRKRATSPASRNNAHKAGMAADAVTGKEREECRREEKGRL